MGSRATSACATQGPPAGIGATTLGVPADELEIFVDVVAVVLDLVHSLLGHPEQGPLHRPRVAVLHGSRQGRLIDRLEQPYKHGCGGGELGCDVVRVLCTVEPKVDSLVRGTSA